MPQQPEDAFDDNRNFAAIREALPVDDAIYERIVATVLNRCMEKDVVGVIKENPVYDQELAIVAIDVILRFVLHHQIPVHALYARNKLILEGL